jgi:hypothetical chaperone protein
VLGLDFGTTNSAIAAVAPNGTARLATFAEGDGQTATFRSILYIDPEAPGESGLPPRVSAGPAAIREWLETGGRGRLIQSIKAHLASRNFTTTNLFGVQYRLEDLIALFLRALRRAAIEQLGDPGHAVVVGRPVHFSGARTPEDDAFAEQRLRTAVQQAGFEEVVFALEPLAAATQYQQRLDHEELVLIGDFGGGTSDFSLVRLGPNGSTILGVDGVALAGDAFDARLIRHLAAPGLGAGSLRRTPFGNELAMPGWIYERVERWDQLSFLKSRDTLETLRTLRHESLEPEKIDALMHLVDDDLGFRLHGDIEGTKRTLSTETHAAFRFDAPPIALGSNVTRIEMEAWIAPVVDAIAGCVDRLFATANVPPAEVATVFLTGGTAFVPAVRRLFAERFARANLRGGDELTTVAKGLALRAAG